MILDSEKFVNGRIRQYFGREDICEYLTLEPIGEREWADWLRVWQDIAEKLFTEQEARHFEEIAIGFLPRPYNYTLESSQEFIGGILMGEAKLDVRQMGSLFLVRFSSRYGREDRYFLIGKSIGDGRLWPSDFARFFVSSHNAVDLHLSAGWNFLLGRLKATFDRVKAEAAKDLESACAVSQDGANIVMADLVYLVSPGGKINASLIYGTSGSLRVKFLKPDDVTRFKIKDSEQIKAITSLVASRVVQGAFVVPEKGYDIPRYLILPDTNPRWD